MKLFAAVSVMATLAWMPCAAWAGQPGDGSCCQHLEARLGWSIGGTMPLDMPAEIRGVNSYTPKANIQVGVGYEYMLDNRWGVMADLNVENKSMETDARVMNYHMAMVQGGERIEGNFTGNVVTQTTMWQLALPVRATFRPLPSLRLKLGPYVAFGMSRGFEGYAYSGYLRHNTPTGPRVNIGNTADKRGDYDFSSDLRTVNWGLDLGADWLFSSHWGAYVDLSWGMNGAFVSSFHTIDSTMYPVYGTLGVAYRIF